MSTRRKVLVHVGAPKTGTSFLQDLLFRNREPLAEKGILYPADRFDEHFLAALDLMELSWGGLERQAVGAWDRLAEKVRAWPGTAIVSHEILATASRQQVRRALDSFGDAEVHIVLSARDLVRQIPAEWQENLKHRRVIDYREFLDKIADPRRAGELASWFWGVQEVPDILDRWGATLPPERVHLVTVPQAGAPRGLLWERFAGVLGLDLEELPAEGARSNPSLGVPESALVRRINARVNGGALGNQHYRALVRELLAHRTLSQRTDSPRLALPEDVLAWAVEVSESWVAALRSRGYDVAGSLEDLRPDVPTAAFVDPDAPDESAVVDAALESIIALLERAAQMRERVTSLHHEADDLRHQLDTLRVDADGLRVDNDGLRGELDSVQLPLGFRIKRRLVRSADHNPVARVGLAAYRTLRGRSSRSV